MKTFTLREAAAFLKMNPEVLRQKAKAGIVPAAKPSKSWVFIEDDLVAYVRSLYSTSCSQRVVQGQTVEVTSWPCTKEVPSGGSISSRQMEQEYEKALGLQTAS